MPGSIDAGDDSFRKSRRGSSFVTLPSLESQFQWERAVSKSMVGKKGKKDIKDMESVMQDLRRNTAVGKPSASKPSYSFTAVAHPQQNAERPIKRLPLPNRPLPHGHSGFQGDVMTTAMLAQLMDRSLVYSGVVDMRNRGITPALALTLSDKMSTFEIKKLDISMNDIGIEGCVHVCRGLLRMKGLEALKASQCGISFENADSNIAEINRQTRENQELVEQLLRDANSLKEVDFSHNRLESSGMGVMVRACPNSSAPLAKTLSTLNLSKTGIRDAASCSSLARLIKNLEALAWLSLEGNAISGSSAAVVARGLSDCKALETCILSHNGFGDYVPSKELARLFSPSSSIRRLDLSYNRITGPPLPSNSPLKEDEDLISQLPALLPYLTRHLRSGADMPEDVQAVSDAVVQVRERLQAEVDAEMSARANGGVVGERLGGSIVDLLGDVKASAPTALQSLDLGGNLISSAVQGVCAHLLLQREPFMSSCMVTGVEERTLRRQVEGDEEEDVVESFTLITSSKSGNFPKSAITIGGLSVWEVSDDQKEVTAELGEHEIEIIGGHGSEPSSVSVLQTIEVRYSSIPPVAPDAPNMAKMANTLLSEETKFTPVGQQDVVEALYGEPGGGGILSLEGFAPKKGGRVGGGLSFATLMSHVGQRVRDAKGVDLPPIVHGGAKVMGLQRDLAGGFLSRPGGAERGRFASEEAQDKFSGFDQIRKFGDGLAPLGIEDDDGGQGGAFDSRKYLKQRSGESHRNLLSLMRRGSSSSTASSNSKISSPGSFSRSNSQMSASFRAVSSDGFEGRLPSALKSSSSTRVLVEVSKKSAKDTSEDEKQRILHEHRSDTLEELDAEGEEGGEGDGKGGERAVVVEDEAGATALQAAMKRRVNDKAIGRNWRIGRDRLFFIKGDTNNSRLVANFEGLDEHYVLNPNLATYACPEVICIKDTGLKEDLHAVLLKVVHKNGGYAEKPHFTHAKQPSIQQRLDSMQFAGNTVGVAKLAAKEMKDDSFWQAIATIKSDCLSDRDSTVTSTVVAPSIVVIGEPFWFTYWYEGHSKRLPGAHESDWIGLFRLPENGKEEKGGLVVRFRPPDGKSAEIQLRHVRWEPGTYQIKMFLVNSDTCIGKSGVFTVKYATATMDCKEYVVQDESTLDITYTLDYHILLHPKSDWIGVYPKGERFLTVHHAAKIIKVPPKNLGTVVVDLVGMNFVGEYQFVYFQSLPDKDVILGTCETTFVPKAPQAPKKFEKSRRELGETRYLKIYISGTFCDMEEERELLSTRVMPWLKPLCDQRLITIVFMDIRFGMSQETEAAELSAASLHASITLTERCLAELDSCLPYFICLLGNVYGTVPTRLPWRVTQLYPWLTDNRYQNPRVSHGARLSLTEMEIINAVLFDPSNAPSALFYFRDASYAVGRGPQFQDSEEWAKVAMNTLKSKVRKTVELSEKTASDHGGKAMQAKPFFHPGHFAKLVTADIAQMVDVDYPASKVPSDLTTFWITLGDCATRHMVKTNAQIEREMKALDTFCGQIHNHFNGAIAEDSARPLLVFGAPGSGKTAAVVRWTQQRIFQRPLLQGYSDLNEKATTYTRFKDSSGKDSFMLAFYLGIHQRLRLHMDILRVLMQTLCDALGATFSDDDLLSDRIHQNLQLRFKAAAARGIHLFIVLDGVDHLQDGRATIDHWLPSVGQNTKNVHWLVTASDPVVSKALVGVRQWSVLSLNTDDWDEGMREGLLQSVIKRQKPAVYREHIERLKEAPLHDSPEFLNCAMDVLRLCREDGLANPLTTWCEGFQDISSMHAALLKKWCSEVDGAQLCLSFVALSETGMYEHELVELLQVPTELPTSKWQDLTLAIDDVSYVSCGIRQFCNRRIAQVLLDNILNKEQKQLYLRKMERYFGAMPTCNRKLAEYPFILEKLHDLNGMYAYITNIQIFFLMYSNPLRKQQFLQYIESLGKAPSDVQHTLRINFEDYFKLTRRWFSDAFNSLAGGAVMYYELNPIIYRSEKDLLYFDDAVFYMSQYFELYGKHLDCIRDLEASLKALYGTSDIFSIPKINATHCRFPARVSRTLRRLSHLYSLHLNALLNYWLAPNSEGIPRHEMPQHMQGIDVSWWTTLVPEGQARTLPSKLKLIYMLARALARSSDTRDDNVDAVVENEKVNGHLTFYVWNNGAKNFVKTRSIEDSRDAYGSCARDSVTLESIPATVNHPLPVARLRGTGKDRSQTHAEDEAMIDGAAAAAAAAVDDDDGGGGCASAAYADEYGVGGVREEDLVGEEEGEMGGAVGGGEESLEGCEGLGSVVAVAPALAPHDGLHGTSSATTSAVSSVLQREVSVASVGSVHGGVKESRSNSTIGNVASAAEGSVDAAVSAEASMDVITSGSVANEASRDTVSSRGVASELSGQHTVHHMMSVEAESSLASMGIKGENSYESLGTVLDGVEEAAGEREGDGKEGEFVSEK